uniref:Uncharacterized protein n=1 Tax=Megaselia scalaris TaxID=36166 RepID=T1GQ92_MEGSC
MSVGTENYPSNFQDSGFQHEEIFIYVKYKIKSHYIKLNFKSDLKIVKAAISEVFGGLQMDNYNLFWDEAQILEEDLVALIKAKKSCGYFKLIVDEKEMSSCKNIKQEPSNFLEEESALEGFVDDQTDNNSKKSTKNLKVESQISEEDNFNAFHFLEIENQEPHTSKSLIETTEDENLTTFNFVDFLKENIVTKTLLEASSSDYSSELLLKRSVISAAVKFLFRHCGTLPTKHQKDLMIQVILDVFKHLNFEDMNLFKVITVKMSNERVKMRKEDSDRKRKTEDHESPAALRNVKNWNIKLNV